MAPTLKELVGNRLTVYRDSIQHVSSNPLGLFLGFLSMDLKVWL